jgi:aspartyl/asparaginyl beta-hydroxylase (cupin superfamily)
MNFNYKMYGNIDVQHLKDKINTLDWNEHTLRQKLFKMHKHTQTLEIMWDIDSLQTDKVGKTHPNYYQLDMESFLNNIKPIYEKNFGKGYFIRILFVKLKSNTNIAPHVDSGKSLVNCKRTHIPIITNPKVTFTIDGETKHLKEGEIWEINNTRNHSVDNNSDEDRIHLIIDWYTYPPNIKKSIL